MASKTYRKSLACFMGFRDGTTYPPEHEFSADTLSTIAPEEIAAWFRLLAYGTPTPSPTDKPTLCRERTLENHKKKLSFFMPAKGPWDEGSRRGNPTKSNTVRAIIKALKKAQVCGEGAPSQATRAFTVEEFRQLLDLAPSIRKNEADVA